MEIKIKLDTQSDTYYEDIDELNSMIKASAYKDALDTVWQDCFRPFWKHGYPNNRINQLIEQDSITNEELCEIIEYLGNEYADICRRAKED